MTLPMHLLVILLLIALAGTLSSLGLLSADTARAATAEWRVQREVDVLLGVEADDERGNVDNLLADTDVTLTDQDAGVVNGLGKTELVDAGLEAALQEILDLQGQHVIELHARLVEDTDADKTANQGISLEETLGVLLVESEELTIGFLATALRGQSIGVVTYRAARRILDRVRPTRQTSRLLRRPYSPTSFSSESLLPYCQFRFTNDLNRVKLMFIGRWN